MTKGGFFVENTLRRIVDADRASRLSVEKARERRENLSEELSRRHHLAFLHSHGQDTSAAKRK